MSNYIKNVFINNIKRTVGIDSRLWGKNFKSKSYNYALKYLLNEKHFLSSNNLLLLQFYLLRISTNLLGLGNLIRILYASLSLFTILLKHLISLVLCWHHWYTDGPTGTSSAGPVTCFASLLTTNKSVIPVLCVPNKQPEKHQVFRCLLCREQTTTKTYKNLFFSNSQRILQPVFQYFIVDPAKL